MKGIILAGGEGKRLQPLALGVPKPLVMVKDKPLINYNLVLFSKYGVHDIKILIRPEDETFYKKWYRENKENFPAMKIDLIAEPEPMGTLGYIFHHLRGWMGQDNIFITNGDDIKEIDLLKMLTSHRAEGMPATVALMKMEKPDDYGVVLVREDKIKSFLEKQRGLSEGLVSAGMYIITPGALGHVATTMLPEKKFLMFERELFPMLAKENKLGAFVSEGTFFDCGTPERLERAIREA